MITCDNIRIGHALAPSTYLSHGSHMRHLLRPDRMCVDQLAKFLPRMNVKL